MSALNTKVDPKVWKIRRPLVLK